MRKSLHIRLFGRFQVLDETGEAIRLPTKRAEALLAWLALDREHGIARGEAAETLWPNVPVGQRRDNLRQAIAAIRKAVGPDFLETNRSHCRLADGLVVCTDIENPSLRDGSTFMPGFEAVWFDVWRERLGVGRSKTSGASLLTVFIEMLERFSEYDSEKMLCLMRDNLVLVSGIPAKDRRRLLTKATKAGNLASWKEFFEADNTMGCGCVALGVKRHKAVIEQAEILGDTRMAVLAAVQLRIGAGLLGRFDEAQSAAALCTSIAASSKETDLRVKAMQNQGLLLMDMGNVREGWGLLKESAERDRDRFEAACTLGLTGFFFASTGHTAKVSPILRVVEPLASTSGHGFLKVLCILTRALTVFHDSGPEDAIPYIASAIATADSFENMHLVVAARETLATALVCLGEHKQARSELARAQAIRNSISALPTPMDRIRRNGLLRRSGISTIHT